MNSPISPTRCVSSTLLALAAALGFLALAAPGLRAARAEEPPQKTYATPEEAVAALRTAVQSQDPAALREVFGPDLDNLLTGDAVQDANNRKNFAAAMAKECRLAKEGADKITLEVGENHWPMPIPLVRADGQWHFDTAAGEEETIDRHVGRDELNAIGVCRAYVTAQRKYARENPGEGAYARHFKSLPGKKDGLYWPTGGNEPASPFGPLVAKAESEGYTVHPRGTGPHPFYGYYFRILTRQGPAAPGGARDYLSGDKLAGGFALVAYPVEWGRSGVMTFIVNQDGKVYQQNLGEQSAERAGSLKEYNPDRSWELVKDEGILRAASERE